MRMQWRDESVRYRWRDMLVLMATIRVESGRACRRIGWLLSGDVADNDENCGRGGSEVRIRLSVANDGFRLRSMP